MKRIIKVRADHSTELSVFLLGILIGLLIGIITTPIIGFFISLLDKSVIYSNEDKNELRKRGSLFGVGFSVVFYVFIYGLILVVLAYDSKLALGIALLTVSVIICTLLIVSVVKISRSL